MTAPPEYAPGMKRRSYLENLLWNLHGAAAIGIASGLACVVVRLFFRLLQWLLTGHAGLLADAAHSLPSWRRVVTPAIGALCAMAVTWIAKRFVRAGAFEEYVEAVRLHGGRIPFVPTLGRTISSAFSVASGAAIGREGSMIQFASAATSLLGRRAKISLLPLATQVACGAAAAVATVYQAPIAGMFFAAEIVIGKIALADCPLLLVAAFAGSLTGRFILGGGPLFAVHARLGADLPHILLAVIAAALIGVLGPAYQWVVRSLRFSSRLPLPLLWSGLLVGALSLSSAQVWGNGDAALLSMMQSTPALSALLSIFLLRLCATTFCVGTGTVGGVFTPTLFAGSAIGLIGIHLIHGSNPLLFAIVGMGCLLAAVTHAPLMATLMAVELTGQWRLLPLILVCNLIAWGVARSLSSRALYGIATSEPGGELPRESRPSMLADEQTVSPKAAPSLKTT